MKSALVDVPVLVIFFNRPNVLKQVFDQVKHARPSKLYLYQDGARLNNETDEEKIEDCRRIVSDIDWECDVHTLFQEKNYGCDPSEYIAQKWMFATEGKGIVLEDDDVPSISFFRFCKELLDKYEHDERIYMISGMNHLGKCENDRNEAYLFTRNFSIWGWATWKRIIDEWDPQYDWMSQEDVRANVIASFDTKYCSDYLINTLSRHKASGREHYESISESAMRTSSRLCIVPTVNMISNIGLTDDATHTKMKLEQLPKRYQGVFYQPTYEIEKVVHPRYVLEDYDYKKKVNHMLYRTDSFWDKLLLRIEVRLRRLRYRR